MENLPNTLFEAFKIFLIVFAFINFCEALVYSIRLGWLKANAKIAIQSKVCDVCFRDIMRANEEAKKRGIL